MQERQSKDLRQRQSFKPNQPCTISHRAASLICLLCFNRLSINSIAATEYRFSGLFMPFCSSVFAMGDTGVVSSSTCLLQSDGEFQIGCVNNGLAFIGACGPGGFALAYTKGLNGGASGLMALWDAFGDRVALSAERLNSVVRIGVDVRSTTCVSMVRGSGC